MHRFVDIAKLVHAQVGRLRPGRRPHRGGHQHLTPMTGRFHPGRRVDHGTEVVAAALLGLAQVHPHPHPQSRSRPPRGPSKLALGLCGSSHRVRCTGESSSE